MSRHFGRASVVGERGIDVIVGVQVDRPERGGDIDLRIPTLPKGSFFPLILEPRRRIDQALYAVVMEAYVAGVSTRAVDDLVAALGIDSGISSPRSRVSAADWTRS